MLYRLCVIQCRALTALHSLTPIVSIGDLGDKVNLVTIWESLYVMATDKNPGTYYLNHAFHLLY